MFTTIRRLHYVLVKTQPVNIRSNNPERFARQGKLSALSEATRSSYAQEDGLYVAHLFTKALRFVRSTGEGKVDLVKVTVVLYSSSDKCTVKWSRNDDVV